MDPFYFVGQIVLLPFAFTPKGFAVCDGRLLSIVRYVALFALIGTNFGGDGLTTFALPDYRGMAPTGSRYFIALEGVFPTP